MGCLKSYESLCYCCITLQYHNSILHHKLSCQGYWFYKYEISRIIQPASAQNDQNKSTDIPHPEICKRLMTPGENTVPTKLHTDVMTKWNYWWEFGKVFQWCTFDKTLPPPTLPFLFRLAYSAIVFIKMLTYSLKLPGLVGFFFLCPFYFFSPNNMHCIQNYNVALYWGCKLIQSKLSLSNLHLTH